MARALEVGDKVEIVGTNKSNGSILYFGGVHREFELGMIGEVVNIVKSYKGYKIYNIKTEYSSHNFMSRRLELKRL